MTATCGIVSVVADQNAKAAVGASWVKAVTALSPKLAFVRASISADRHGNVDVALLKRGLHAFADAGLPVWAVIEANLAGQGYNPNETLGFQGDHFKNAWIEAQTNATISLLHKLGPVDSPKTLYWLNEPNSQAALNPLGSGKVIPTLYLGGTADPLKPEAMSPQAYFASLYHAAYWIKRECPWVHTIYPAALSCFVAFHTSLSDDWLGNYWANGVKYLTDHGLTPPWPWSSVALTLEGLVDVPYSHYVRDGVATILRNTGTTGGLVVAEFGVPASSPGRPLNVPAMRTAVQAIHAIADSASFFAAHCTGGYGIWPVSYQHGEILPGTPTDWFQALPEMLATLG